MALTYVGTGGLFERIGLLAGAINTLNTERGSTLNTRFTNIDAQYQSAQQEVVNSLWTTRDSARTSGNTLYSALVSLANNTVIEQVDDEQALTTKTVSAALTQLVTEMESDLEYIRQPSTGNTVTAGGSNVGDAEIVVSLLDGEGLSRDYVFAEDITITATNDSSRGATAFRESFSAVGEPSVATTAYNWPQGSGASTTLTAVDAAQDGIVTGGAFEGSWISTNTPPSPWSIQTGTAGTTVFRGSTPARSTGTYNLRLTGTGAAENTAVEQTVTTSLGTQPLAAVAFCCQVKTDSTPAAGVLTARLVDGSNSTISDEAGNSNAITKDLTGVSTDYEAFKGTFRLPNDVPDVIKLQIYLSTAITSGRSVDIDLVQMVVPSPLYNGGPYVSVFSGTTASVKDDTYTVAVTNDGDTGDFCRSLDRIYGLRDLGVRIPSSGSPTINDSLIT